LEYLVPRRPSAKNKKKRGGKEDGG